MTFESAAASLVSGGSLLRRYRMKDASGGNVANVGATAGSLDLTYTGGSVTIGNAGPTSEFEGMLVAGSDAALTVPDASDVQVLTNGMLLFVWNQTGRTNASSRISKKNDFGHLYMQWDTGEIELRLTHTGAINIDSNGWSDSLGWSILAVGWTSDSSDPVAYWGSVGGTTTATTWTGSPSALSGTAQTNTNPWYFFHDNSTSDRVTLNTCAEIWILNAELSKAQVDNLCTLAGTEPASGSGGAQMVGNVAAPHMSRRRRWR